MRRIIKTGYLKVWRYSKVIWRHYTIEIDISGSRSYEKQRKFIGLHKGNEIKADENEKCELWARFYKIN